MMPQDPAGRIALAGKARKMGQTLRSSSVSLKVYRLPINSANGAKLYRLEVDGKEVIESAPLYAINQKIREAIDGLG